MQPITLTDRLLEDLFGLLFISGGFLLLSIGTHRTLRGGALRRSNWRIIIGSTSVIAAIGIGMMGFGEFNRVTHELAVGSALYVAFFSAVIFAVLVMGFVPFWN